MTRVAVVIPVHDDGPLVCDALASLREDGPVEVVVVDDGSTDAETQGILGDLEANGVRVVRRENGGPGAARMTGVAATTAPYVFPLDADDLLEPGALDAMADRLDAHPEAGFCWGDYLLFGEYDGRYRSPGEFLPWTLTWVNPYPVSSLIRRTALERVGGWAPRGYEDWGLWLSFVEQGITGVPAQRIVYRRRLHGGGRVLAGDRRAHQRLYAELRRRHASAFADRARLRAIERPALWKRAIYPVLFGRRALVPFALEAWMQRTMMRRGLRLSR